MKTNMFKSSCNTGLDHNHSTSSVLLRGFRTICSDRHCPLLVTDDQPSNVLPLLIALGGPFVSIPPADDKAVKHPNMAENDTASSSLAGQTFSWKKWLDRVDHISI